MFSELENVEIIGQAQRLDEARESISKLNPHVVILDSKLPDGSSIDFLQEIKKDDPCLKVIIFSDQTFPQYRDKFLELGADGFFTKFTEYEKIPEVINQWANEDITGEKKDAAESQS